MRILVHSIALAALGLAGCGENRAPDAAASAAATAGDDVAAAPTPDPPLARINLSQAVNLPHIPGQTRCKDVWGYLDDPDPAGRIVRNAPNPDGKELGRILPFAHPSARGMDFPPTFEILGSKDGWLAIEHAGFDEQINGRGAPKMYSGRGWIAGGGVRITLQSRLGFAAPSHTAPVLIDLQPDYHFDELRQQRILACDGRWVLADWIVKPDKSLPDRTLPTYRRQAVVSERPLVLRAWVAGVCNIQETTCDGVDGSRAQSSRLEGDY